MAEVNGGALLARCLANEGVRFVFGLPSPEIDPLLAALDAHGIRLVPFRHESAGAHMAEGLYKTTGEVAVVIGNPGPGSANLVGGVITARHEGVPMVAITSQHRLGIVYPSLPSTFQGQDQLDVSQAGRQVGRTDLLVGSHSRRGTGGVPRDVDWGARDPCTSSCRRRSSTPPATSRACACRPPRRTALRSRSRPTRASRRSPTCSRAPRDRS